MNKIANITSSVAAGIIGAALFLLLAFALHVGGLGETQTSMTIPSQDTRFVSSPFSAGGSLDPDQRSQKHAASVVQIISPSDGTRNNTFHTSQSQPGVGS